MKMLKKLSPFHLMVLIVGLFILFFVLNRSPFSKDILYVTEPVNTIEGVVTGTGKNSMRIAYTGKSKDKNGKIITKIITYTVKVDNNTIIRQTPSQQSVVPGTLSQRVAPPETTNNLPEKGQKVRVSTTSDLRFIQNNEFIATDIIVSSERIQIKGTVVSISNTSIVVYDVLTRRAPNDNALDSQKPPGNNFTLKFKPDTQYFEVVWATKGSTIKKIAMGDIRAGDEVVLGINGDLSAQKDTYVVSILKIPLRPTPQPPTPFVTPAVVK